MIEPITNITTNIKSIEPKLNECKKVTMTLTKIVTNKEVPGTNFVGILII